VARRGAANIDSRCTGTTMRDYLRATNLEHLPEEIVKLYDDGTEVGASVVYFGDRLVNEAANSTKTIDRSAEVSSPECANPRDLRAVAKAYNKGKSIGDETSAHRMACAVLTKRHPEMTRLDELALYNRVSQIIQMAVLAGYLVL
jgi:hypothetical protein